MAEVGDVASLRETLCAQQKLLGQLYNELDVEREAAASAASEALSMILRLQGEKATVQMEAEQYKRLAEEKMCHAEEALAIFEDLIFQKEMEIAALDYQVQAYRYKLLSMGCSDPGGSEIKFPEHLLQLNESVMGDTNLQSLSRRNSLPLLPLKFWRSGNGRENSPEVDLSKLLDEQTYHEMNEQSSDLEKKTESSGAGSINSYWEQIRKLDERVKLIAGAGSSNLRRDTRSPSPFSRINSGNDLARLDQIKHPGSTSENENNTDFSCSPNVLDVFEVPQMDKDTTDTPIPMPIKNEGKITLQECDSRLERPDSFPKESLNLSEKEKRDLLKRLLAFPHQENSLRRLSEGSAVSVKLANVQPTTSVSDDSQTKLLQPDRPSEIMEAEREEASSPDREVVLNLLYEIKDQLNLLHTEVTSLKTDKSSSSQVDDLSLVSLKEAMLHFWL